MIYQMPDTALNPKQRIGDVIGRPLRFYLGMSARQRRERIRELLPPDRAGAGSVYRPPAGANSPAGRSSAICIARALAAEPELIICDEVTSALDQLVAEGILRLLDAAADASSTLAYLFITHDIATVRGHRRRGRGDVPGPDRGAGTEAGDVHPAPSMTTLSCCCPRSRRWILTGSTRC